MNMTVKDLKRIINELPDDLDVIIPVVDEDDANNIISFRHVRTAGVLHTPGENDALCLNTASNGMTLVEQIENRHSDVECLYCI